jgi:ABC-type sugar transport system ATPase subunit
VLDGVSVALRRGEIVGVAGLRGSGASELLHALFGSYGKLAGGAVRLLDQPYTPRAPAHAIDAGIVLLPNDRASSVFSSMSVLHNATLSSLRLRSGPWLRTADEARAVAPLATRLRMVLPSLDAPIGQLSGGNQQKVMLARCLLARPKLLLLDEPTRGIDVGAKADVHELIRELSAGGVAVLFVASDVEELLALAHRVVVLFRGRVVAELERQALSRERLVSATMGAASGAV